MDLAKLQKELYKENQWLIHKLTEQQTLVVAAAQAEHDYRIALAIKLLEYRTAGAPATIMGDLCRGDKVIAKLKLERDIARGMSDACKQGIIATQSSMNGLQTLISVEKAAMKLL